MVDPEELREEEPEPETPAEPEPHREPPDYVIRKKPFEKAPGLGKKADATKSRPTKKGEEKGPSPTSAAPLSSTPKGEGQVSILAPPAKVTGKKLQEVPVPRPAQPRLIVPPGSARLGSVPTTIEGIMASDSSTKSANEVLGILVEAHIQEADSILGRTRLSYSDLTTVTNALDLARHGIGGLFDRPMPRVSEWVLSKLRALPSIEGKSRTEFVTAWRSAEERLRAEESARNRQREKFANA